VLALPNGEQEIAQVMGAAKGVLTVVEGKAGESTIMHRSALKH
jgi:hypothetical protein